MPNMRNVNVFVDVDLTLVDHLCVLKPGAVEAMQTLFDGGCHLFLSLDGRRTVLPERRVTSVRGAQTIAGSWRRPPDFATMAVCSFENGVGDERSGDRQWRAGTRTLLETFLQ
jgi:hypothetical protein